MNRSSMLPFLRKLSRHAMKLASGKKDGAEKEGKNYFGHYSNRLDLCIEEFVKGEAAKAGMRLITEERPEELPGTGGTIVLDPLDGSKNYEAGYPAFAFAVAVSKSVEPAFGDIEASLVLDLSNGVEYSSVKGKGFFVNAEPAVKLGAKRATPLIAGDFGGSVEACRMFSELSEFAYMRMLGASTLDMAMLAQGSLDAYVDIRGKLIVTHTAGLALLRDSGAILTDVHGDTITAPLDQGTVYTVVAARNASLHRKLLRLSSKAANP